MTAMKKRWGGWKRGISEFGGEFRSQGNEQMSSGERMTTRRRSRSAGMIQDQRLRIGVSNVQRFLAGLSQSFSFVSYEIID